jgi:endonuclease V-like protein UPF0215 family
LNQEFLTNIKDGIFSVAIDDANHTRGDLYTSLFFIICRGTLIENVIRSKIQVDGLDSTEVIIKTLTPIQDQFQIILIHGITVAGLNIIDISLISLKLRKPLIAITENAPHSSDFLNAINSLPHIDERKDILKKAGDLYSVNVKFGTIYYYLQGTSESIAKKFFNKFCIRSKLPEQLLIAHKIASFQEK